MPMRLIGNRGQTSTTKRHETEGIELTNCYVDTVNKQKKMKKQSQNEMPYSLQST